MRRKIVSFLLIALLALAICQPVLANHGETHDPPMGGKGLVAERSDGIRMRVILRTILRAFYLAT